MDLDLKGKVAVVTASSRGLGQAVARALAEEGCKLALCARDEKALAETAERIRSDYSAEVFAMPCDVTHDDEVKKLSEKVKSHYGTVHILFVNAGGPPAGTAGDFLPNDYRYALDLNLMSAVNCVYSFLMMMKEAGWGRIIASTSITVKEPLPNLVLSNVSRAGVVAFIKSLSRELAPYGITANSVAPGYIMTDRVKNLISAKAQTENITQQEALDQIVTNIPVGRIGKAEEFGALVAFLASDKSGYINGETILIDGGQYRGLM